MVLLVHLWEETVLDFHSIPEAPVIDFSSYTVLWYADKGSNASFVELQSLAKNKEGGVSAEILVFHSDFGSRRLNLWRLQKSAGPLQVEEKPQYDRGP